jgi:hypothetical protein
MSKSDPRLDVRVVNFHLRAGNVSHEDYNSYLNDLPDDAEEGVEVEVRFDNAFERRSAEDENTEN